MDEHFQSPLNTAVFLLGDVEHTTSSPLQRTMPILETTPFKTGLPYGN